MSEALGHVEGAHGVGVELDGDMLEVGWAFGLRSTMMSRMAPRVQRTSLVSAAGGYWKCMPRSVPFLRVRRDARLGDDRLQAELPELVLAEGAAKKPRSSLRRSRSMMNAPLSLVSVKITCRCLELGSDGAGVPEVRREHAVGDQLLDVADALVTRTLELLEGEPGLADRLQKAARRRGERPIAA